jgi:hypothetical protein
MSLTFEPLIPPGVWLTLAAALAAALAAYAWRRPWGVSRATWGGIVGLMSTGAALILGILLNPMWQERVPLPAGKPRLTVLIDESASMNVKDMPGGRTRFYSAAAAARACA